MPEERQRLDKWLWFARFARTRAAAKSLVEAGHVRVGGRRIATASHGVRIGDVLTVAAPHGTIVARVEAFAVRRGGAPEARTLYRPLGGDGSSPALEEPDPSV